MGIHPSQQEIKAFFHGTRDRYLPVSPDLAWEGEEIFQTRKSLGVADGRQ